MKTLEQLLETEEPAIDRVRAWIERSERRCEVLPPSTRREELLVRTQVSTRSPLGAIVHETGGILIDSGWIRILGSGSDRLGRSLPAWNEGRGEHGFLLVADDAVSGFFAINGGALGDDRGKLYYLPPDSLAWTPLGVGYSRFLRRALDPGMDAFYEHLRWEGWPDDVARLHGDRTFAFFPPLWSPEGSMEGSERRSVKVWEAYRTNLEFMTQLG